MINNTLNEEFVRSILTKLNTASQALSAIGSEFNAAISNLNGLQTQANYQAGQSYGVSNDYASPSTSYTNTASTIYKPNLRGAQNDINIAERKLEGANNALTEAKQAAFALLNVIEQAISADRQDSSKLRTAAQQAEYGGQYLSQAASYADQDVRKLDTWKSQLLAALKQADNASYQLTQGEVNQRQGSGFASNFSGEYLSQSTLEEQLQAAKYQHSGSGTQYSSNLNDPNQLERLAIPDDPNVERRVSKSLTSLVNKLISKSGDKESYYGNGYYTK
jgi:hypothetical protein